MKKREYYTKLDLLKTSLTKSGVCSSEVPSAVAASIPYAVRIYLAIKEICVS